LHISQKANETAAAQDANTNFVTSLKMATDKNGTYEQRIAGVWSLSDYWHNAKYSTTVANALSAITASSTDGRGPDNATGADELRQAAADAIGQAITVAADGSDEPQDPETVRTRILLYGDARPGKGNPGTITRVHQALWSSKAALLADKANLQEHMADLADVERRLRATREAIRENWENLNFVILAAHDLSGINFYRAHLRGAYMANANLTYANLCGADLSLVTLTGADLRYANLAGADLRGSIGWDHLKGLDGANLAGVKNAPESLAANVRQGAVNLPKANWMAHLDELKTADPPRPISMVYTHCDEYPIQ
jgi:hypothetical protein